MAFGVRGCLDFCEFLSAGGKLSLKGFLDSARCLKFTLNALRQGGALVQLLLEGVDDIARFLQRSLAVSLRGRDLTPCSREIAGHCVALASLGFKLREFAS